MDLREWETVHAVALVAEGTGNTTDVHALVELPGTNYHMIRRACRQRLNADTTTLVREVRATAECSTNLVVHEYGDTCIAIVDVAERCVAGGLAPTPNLKSFHPREDGWLTLKIRLLLERSFHVYLGTADGLNLM